MSVSLFHVSSVVGAPWRCGVLTTKGGRAGVGSGHLSRREHDSIHPEWSGSSSWRKRIVAKENGASPDWIVAFCFRLCFEEL